VLINRSHLRGMVLEGLGSWSPSGLLGPLADLAISMVPHVAWGFVEGIGELPEQLPKPPSARPLWLVVTVLAIATIVLVWSNSTPTTDIATYPLEISFVEGRGGIWTEFDVAEEAVVTIFSEHDGQLELVIDASSTADKAALAVGDGSYRTHTLGSGVLVVSTATPILSLDNCLSAANHASTPLEQLAIVVRNAHPQADLHLYRR
ncbi:MAG: hypothetical protein HN348_24760, partial [Proteobacteria bacterium]|nr:hypothetical protein [Pseudomonadota bacterium]